MQVCQDPGTSEYPKSAENQERAKKEESKPRPAQPQPVAPGGQRQSRNLTQEVWQEARDWQSYPQDRATRLSNLKCLAVTRKTAIFRVRVVRSRGEPSELRGLQPSAALRGNLPLRTELLWGLSATGPWWGTAWKTAVVSRRLTGKRRLIYFTPWTRETVNQDCSNQPGHALKTDRKISRI